MDESWRPDFEHLSRFCGSTRTKDQLPRHVPVQPEQVREAEQNWRHLAPLLKRVLPIWKPAMALSRS